MFLTGALIGCADVDRDLSDSDAQVSQGVDRAPEFICSEPAVTHHLTGEASSIACEAVPAPTPLL